MYDDIKRLIFIPVSAYFYPCANLLYSVVGDLQKGPYLRS